VVKEENPRIFVVEDEEGVAQLVRDLLESEGFAVQAAAHPDATRAIDRTDPPDLILIDMMLPGQDGVKLAGQLRETGLGHTPMIAMSASRIMLHFASESGLFQETVAKPFDLTTLLGAVRRNVGLYVTGPHQPPAL
jgi:CheY-like chemotaxis protein